MGPQRGRVSRRDDRQIQVPGEVMRDPLTPPAHIMHIGHISPALILLAVEGARPGGHHPHRAVAGRGPAPGTPGQGSTTDVR